MKRNYSKKLKFNGATAERMTMKKLEHMVVDNEYATTKISHFDEMRSVHLSFQEPQHMDIVSTTNETTISSDSKNKDTTCLSDVTVL